MRLGVSALVALLLAGLPAIAAEAASLEVRLPLVEARRAWKGRVDSFNPADVAANAVLQFFASDGTAFPAPGGLIVAKGSTSLSVGATTGTPFRGAGVLSADQPLAAVCRQAGTGTARTVPTYYRHFDPATASAGRFYLPLALRSRSLRTTVGVQNLGAVDAVAALSFFDGGATPVKVLDLPPIPGGASAVVDLASVPGLPAGFDGSVVISAVQAGTATPAPVAAAARVVATRGREAYAFSGSPGTADTLLVPDAGCLTSAGRTTASRIAVQNAAEVPARLTVTYYYPLRRPAGTVVRTVSSTTALLEPGTRRSFDPCRKRELRGRRRAIAVVTARDGGGLPTPVAAVTRWTRSGAGTQNAYAAVPPPEIGVDLKYRVVLPSVAWARRRGERTTIQVMNADPTAGASVAPVAVTATFYPRSGAPVSRPLALLTRASVSASSAKALTGGSFSGAVVLESDAPIAAAASVRRIGARVADGYAGLPW